jgi:hypothetical protein
MSPEMLVKVNEFAANLRDGKVTLPLDDRSAVLMKENKYEHDSHLPVHQLPHPLPPLSGN